jgi:hypothetical protein
VIQLSDSGGDPNWSSGVIAFAEAVTVALQGVAGPFDVSPQVFSLNAYDSATVVIPLLSFPVSNVLSVQINYSVSRHSTLANVADAGVLTMVYNANNPVNSKWELNRIGESDGGANITFSVNDAGIVSFTTTTITGLNHTGFLCYSARALTFA